MTPHPGGQAFTDEDLKRWKKQLKGSFVRSNAETFRHDEVEALLARLEAAERYIDAVWRHGAKSEEEYWAWRKAAGK